MREDRNSDALPLTRKLRPHFRELRAASRGGNAHATRVIELFHTQIACPEVRGTTAQCVVALDEWLKSRDTAA